MIAVVHYIVVGLDFQLITWLAAGIYLADHKPTGLVVGIHLADRSPTGRVVLMLFSLRIPWAFNFRPLARQISRQLQNEWNRDGQVVHALYSHRDE